MPNTNRRKKGSALPTGSRYAVYVRCSSDDQKHGDFSTIDAQREINRQYVSDKGGVLAGEYADEGKTGTNLKRSGWQMLLADAQAGKFDAVCVTYMSRLGRGDTFIVAEYILRDKGVRVEMVKEQFTDDVSGFVNKSMTRFVDAMYVENVRQWTRTKMEQMVKNGFFCGGYPPFGYRKVFAPGMAPQNGKDPPKVLVPHEDEAPLVEAAFALFTERRTLAAVRDWLNTVTTRAWTTTTTKNLLTNEIYLGIQHFGQWRNEASHPPIVAAELWQNAQEILAQGGGGGGGRRAVSGSFTYLLRGRVYCPHCGVPYTQASAHGNGGTKSYYYVCLNANKRIHGGVCPVSRINANRLHQAVITRVVRGMMDSATLQHSVAEGDWSGAEERILTKRAAVVKKRKVLAGRVKRLTENIGDGGDVATLLPMLKQTQAELERAETELAAVDADRARQTMRQPIAADVRQAWRGLAQVWHTLPAHERTQILQGVVLQVEVVGKYEARIDVLGMPQAAWTARS